MKSTLLRFRVPSAGETRSSCSDRFFDTHLLYVTSDVFSAILWFFQRRTITEISQESNPDMERQLTLIHEIH
jgi:hypothetical protein